MADEPTVVGEKNGSGDRGVRTFRLTITQVASYLIVTRKVTRSFQGSVSELEAEYKKVQLRNALLGWWGIPFGLIWTPLTLAKNAKAMKQLRALAAAPPAAPAAPAASAAQPPAAT